MSAGLGFTTRSIHTPLPRSDAHGAMAMPVYDSAAFEFESAEAIEAAFAGRRAAHTYSRITNPTVEWFERKVQAVTGAAGVIAVSSGMAAISATVLALCQAGDTILTGGHLFGNTWSLFTRTLARVGIKLVVADTTDAGAVRAQLEDQGRDGIRAIYVETISNPQMEVADFGGLATLAAEIGVPLIADTTMTPPGLFDARAAGVDVEVLSSTKYISGGATSVGGLIIDHGSYDWKRHHLLGADAKASGPFTFLARLRKQVYRDLGQCLSPHNAFLQSTGLDTLRLRAERSSENALRLATFLRTSPGILAVHHPGLDGSPWRERASRWFPLGTGGVFTVELGGKAAAFRLVNALKLARRATNIHDNRTLVIHPASTIFCEYNQEQRRALGVPDSLVRISAGIEDYPDLEADFAQALAASTATTEVPQ